MLDSFQNGYEVLASILLGTGAVQSAIAGYVIDEDERLAARLSSDA